MEAEAATTGQNVFWTAYDILAPAVAAAVGYAAIWLTGIIRQRIKNDVAAGLLNRLTLSVADAVDAVNQQQRELIGRARHDQSEAGRRLTKHEAGVLKQQAFRNVRAYWGPKGLRMLARILADGERDKAAAAAQVDRVIGLKVEAAVANRKAASIRTKVPVDHVQPMV